MTNRINSTPLPKNGNAATARVNLFLENNIGDH